MICSTQHPHPEFAVLPDGDAAIAACSKFLVQQVADRVIDPVLQSLHEHGVAFVRATVIPRYHRVCLIGCASKGLQGLGKQHLLARLH